MAVIGNFYEAQSATDRVDPTTVECEWQIVRAPGATLLQLTTFGSAERAFPGKASQKVQIDRKAAMILSSLLERAFPDL